MNRQERDFNPDLTGRMEKLERECRLLSNEHKEDKVVLKNLGADLRKNRLAIANNHAAID